MKFIKFCFIIINVQMIQADWKLRKIQNESDLVLQGASRKKGTNLVLQGASRKKGTKSQSTHIDQVIKSAVSQKTIAIHYVISDDARKQGYLTIHAKNPNNQTYDISFDSTSATSVAFNRYKTKKITKTPIPLPEGGTLGSHYARVVLLPAGSEYAQAYDSVPYDEQQAVENFKLMITGTRGVYTLKLMAIS